jgi:hypothetical protein
MERSARAGNARRCLRALAGSIESDHLPDELSEKGGEPTTLSPNEQSSRRQIHDAEYSEKEKVRNEQVPDVGRSYDHVACGVRAGGSRR